MPEQIKDDYKQPSLEEKVCDYMQLCESEEASHHHWQYLKSLYTKLSQIKKLKNEYKPLLKKLEEFVSKHRNYDSGSGYLDIDGMSMFKYEEDED